jgi:hypothetical protein
MKKLTHSIGSLLTGGDSDHLEHLIRQAQRLARISADLSRQLGSPLGQHVKVANIRGDTAVLQLDSSTWLTKVRYMIPTLIGHLEDYGIHRIQLRVNPSQTLQTEKPVYGRRAKLSQDSARILAAAADSIADPDLASALKRLAKRATSES